MNPVPNQPTLGVLQDLLEINVGFLKRESTDDRTLCIRPGLGPFDFSVYC